MEMSKLKSLRVCFNVNCKQGIMEQPKKGWCLRNNGFAELCDLCGSVYEEGKFCETFHLNASGWRCCETCGKQIHCGCIVSFQLFVLLDAGGIECLACTRRSFVMASNRAWPAWPLPSRVMSSHPERIKNLSGKNWTPIAGSGPIPWREAPSLFSGHRKIEQAKASFEFDVPSCTDILHFSDKMCAYHFEREHKEDSNGKFLSSEKTWGPDIHVPAFKVEALSNAFAIGSDCTVSTKDDAYRNINTASVAVPKNNCAQIFTAKKSHNHNVLDVSTDNEVHSGRDKGDARGRNHVLPRSPRITDQELLEISGENHIITPLFEKTLSASDAGRIGRLILPKKCAESVNRTQAYLPTISGAEGLPLEVRDVKGNEWLLQFRFWSNNNSRMYVLEGVTPCIQSLQLEAGDIVTFSRLEPEGKLIMGGRKLTKENAADTTIGRMSANGTNSKKWTKLCETDSMRISKPEEPVDIDVYNQTKRKSCMLASKSKCLMSDNGSMVELKLTLKEAQRLIRPPPGDGPNVIVIEDCEIEEYEIAPIIGRPSIPSSDCMGEEIQWVQCDDCLKWRKLPADILLPSKWTCSANLWEKEKSMCSVAQELTSEHLTDLLPPTSKASFKKMRYTKPEPDSIETLEALDTLATSLQVSRRHPRHRLGCGCIVCMQPPSGKGPKHKQSCNCIVCESLKRRFRTLMTKKREKQQLGKDAEMTLEKLELENDVDLSQVHQNVVNHHSNDNSPENEISASPGNARLDLNSQPERVKVLAPGSDFSSLFHLIHEATGTQLEQQNQSCPTDGESLGGHDGHQKRLLEAMLSSCIAFDGSHQRIDMDHLSPLPADITSASTSITQ